MQNPPASATRLSAKAKPFRKALLEWYDRNARELPWRSQPSLYRTVVSEFMLQQTQIKTALPYFESWMKRFPDFAALAAAPEAHVLKAWEGLGYYARARNLHKLAKRLAGLPKPPRRTEEWRALPGIGPYTAAAVCSIAFDAPEPCIDGNVVRALARLTADQTDHASSSQAASVYRPLAAALISRRRPGDYNQAVMELGATVCRKASPLCLLCPVRAFCQGHAKGIASTLPRFAKRRYVDKTIDRAWIVVRGRLLLRRPEKQGARLGGLYELPTLEQAGIRLRPSETPLFVGRRSITKHRITERLFDLSGRIGEMDDDEIGLWASLDDLKELPLSGPHARWIRQLIPGQKPSEARQ